MKEFKRVEEFEANEDNESKQEEVVKGVDDNNESPSPREEAQEIPTENKELPEAKEGLLSQSDILGDTPKYSGVDPDAAPSLEPELPEELKDKILDKNNEEVFDPDLHLVDAFGNPRYNKDGSFKKKRGRKPKAQAAIGETIEGERQITKKEANAAAKAYYEAFKRSGTMFMGKDFSVADKETDEYMIMLFENVCIKHNSTGLSPEQMLAVGMGEYTLRKYDEPSCKRYLIDKMLGIKNFFTKRKKEKEEAEVEQ